MPTRLPCLDALSPGLPSLINRPGAHSAAHGSHSPDASTAVWGPDGRGRCGPRCGSHLGGRVLQSPAWATWEVGLRVREAGLGSGGLVFRDGPTRGSRCYATSKCPEGLGCHRATAVLEIHGLPGTVVWPWAGHVTESSLCLPMVGFGHDLFYFTLFYILCYLYCYLFI